MNPFIAGLIGAAIMYLISAIVTLVDEWWLDDAYVAPASALFIVIVAPPICIWKFIRNVCVPITPERQKDKFVQDVIADSVQILPRIYFHHDKKAKAIGNKFFLFRLAK